MKLGSFLDNAAFLTYLLDGNGPIREGAEMLFTTALSALFWIGCVISLGAAFAGFFALVSPTRFASCAGFWGKWVETEPVVPIADHRIDIDRFVLSHPRKFGAIVLAASLFWLALFFQAA